MWQGGSLCYLGGDVCVYGRALYPAPGRDSGGIGAMACSFVGFPVRACDFAGCKGGLVMSFDLPDGESSNVYLWAIHYLALVGARFFKYVKVLLCFL